MGEGRTRLESQNISFRFPPGAPAKDAPTCVTHRACAAGCKCHRSALTAPCVWLCRSPLWQRHDSEEGAEGFGGHRPGVSKCRSGVCVCRHTRTCAPERTHGSHTRTGARAYTRPLRTPCTRCPGDRELHPVPSGPWGISARAKSLAASWSPSPRLCVSGRHRQELPPGRRQTTAAAEEPSRERREPKRRSVAPSCARPWPLRPVDGAAADRGQTCRRH